MARTLVVSAVLLVTVLCVAASDDVRRGSVSVSELAKRFDGSGGGSAKEESPVSVSEKVSRLEKRVRESSDGAEEPPQKVAKTTGGSVAEKVKAYEASIGASQPSSFAKARSFWEEKSKEQQDMKPGLGDTPRDEDDGRQYIDPSVEINDMVTVGAGPDTGAETGESPDPSSEGAESSESEDAVKGLIEKGFFPNGEEHVHRVTRPAPGVELRKPRVYRDLLGKRATASKTAPTVEAKGSGLTAEEFMKELTRDEKDGEEQDAEDKPDNTHDESATKDEESRGSVEEATVEKGPVEDGKKIAEGPPAGEGSPGTADLAEAPVAYLRRQVVDMAEDSRRGSDDDDELRFTPLPEY